MKRGILLILFLFFCWTVFCQQAKPIIFWQETSKSKDRYDKIDFATVDTLQKWCYSIVPNTDPSNIDSTPPICRVWFGRNDLVFDSIGYIKLKEEHGVSNNVDSLIREVTLFKPGIVFKVYLLKDSVAALRIARAAARTTSCLMPHAGGDLFFAGQFIFVNDDICVRCGCLFSERVDYCRPLLNFIFTDLKTKDASTINSLLKGLPINQCN